MRLAGRQWLVVAALAAVLCGCGPTGGYQRGLFQGYVVGATEEEIQGKVGKPDATDASDPKAPRWIYNKKTFDPDNANQVDGRTIVVFTRNAQGKLVGSDVIFSSN